MVAHVSRVSIRREALRIFTLSHCACLLQFTASSPKARPGRNSLPIRFCRCFRFAHVRATGLIRQTPPTRRSDTWSLLQGLVSSVQQLYRGNTLVSQMNMDCCFWSVRTLSQVTDSLEISADIPCSIAVGGFDVHMSEAIPECARTTSELQAR